MSIAEMSGLCSEALEIRGPSMLNEIFDVWEASCYSPEPSERIFSCVAICRKNWRRGWPALGGTRVFRTVGSESEVRQRAIGEAMELAMAMQEKNTLLRKAINSLQRGSGAPWGWQGGKGVIWVPQGSSLSPERLICHGRLIERIGGEYIASKDAGVGTAELKWIGMATRFIIGLSSERDTGEATAYGVISGMKTALAEVGGGKSNYEEGSLERLGVLVCGAGKVGLPLIGLLLREGAMVYVFDPALPNSRAGIQEWYDSASARGAAVDTELLAALVEIQERGGVLNSEEEALAHPGVDIVSPNGGPSCWLSQGTTEKDGQTRAQRIAQTARQYRRVRLVLGAANDQLPLTPGRTQEITLALKSFSEAGIAWVPDPLISLGGVIAVSHELSASWDSERVNLEASLVARQGVHELFRRARLHGNTHAAGLFRAFIELVETNWNAPVMTAAAALYLGSKHFNAISSYKMER